MGNAVIDFIKNVVKEPACWDIHSGGLIAATQQHAATFGGLMLEARRFFPVRRGNGEKAPSTILTFLLSAHEFLNQTEETNFVLYYFSTSAHMGAFP